MKKFLNALILLIYVLSLMLLVIAGVGIYDVYQVTQWTERPVTIISSDIIITGFRENQVTPEIIATDNETGTEIRILDLEPGDVSLRAGAITPNGRPYHSQRADVEQFQAGDVITVFCSADLSCVLRQGNYRTSIVLIIISAVWWVGNIVYSRLLQSSADH